MTKIADAGEACQGPVTRGKGSHTILGRQFAGGRGAWSLSPARCRQLVREGAVRMAGHAGGQGFHSRSPRVLIDVPLLRGIALVKT